MADDGYTTRRVKGAKYMRIHVRGDGSVLITRPWWVSKRRAHRFFQKHRSWIRRARDEVVPRDPDLARSDDDHYREYKEAARELVHRKVNAWNQLYGYEYGRIAIRNQKTRWGSCSAHGNLNFHYKILFLPEHLQDYLVVHELCHLREQNHSRRFWRLVGNALPWYEQARDELRGARGAIDTSAK